MLKYGDKNYITDNDLKVEMLGFLPRREINNKKLKKYFMKNFGRDFLGGDELVAYSQSLVSSDMDFSKLEKEILYDIEHGKPLKDVLFDKTATGIGRGHSLGGLSVVNLGIHGTKMIDSGLTGLCASRSLVTSSRRKETGTGEIAIPESLKNHPELLNEYMQISEDVLNLSKQFKEKFGKMHGVETFNKVIPYNNPADLYIVLPLDTLATIAAEVRADKLNPNGQFIPKELHNLADEIIPEITKQIGQDIMFKQRIEVPRDTYFHYTVFKDPDTPNYALEKGKGLWMDIDPAIVDVQKDFGNKFIKELIELKNLFEITKNITDAKHLHDRALECIYSLKQFSNEYNEALRVKIADTLSWRVWSEQKRHATLRQGVESVYSAAERAYTAIKSALPVIKDGKSELSKGVLDTIEKNIIIDDRLKEKPELVTPYIYHTAKQLMFYGKLTENGFSKRDALYIVPKNIRVRTLENYDLTNLIDLEFPLRLCDACEPERKASSWKKRELIAQAVPEIDYFLTPKCNVGFCTEGKYCGHITDMRKYDKELHKSTNDVMLNKAR